MTYERLREVCLGAASCVAWDKTPGYPLSLSCVSNQVVRDTMFAELIDRCVARLHIWLRDDVVVDETKTFENIERGIIDPSSVFIKAEPHPSRKIVEGKYRCISPVSLVDQIVEKSLFEEVAASLKKRLYVSGSAIGIGFTDPQMREVTDFYRENVRLYGTPISDDVSGFDALHTLQALEATWNIDKKTVDFQGRPRSAWELATKRWWLLSAYSPSVIAGRLYTKTIPGMLNSGSADTSRRNTLLRMTYAHYLGAVMGVSVVALAAGDDCLTWGVSDIEGYKLAASAANITLRDVESCTPDSFDFCSHKFSTRTGRASLESWPKAVYKMASNPTPKRADCMQVYNEIRYNDDGLREKLLRFIDAIAPLT